MRVSDLDQESGVCSTMLAVGVVLTLVVSDALSTMFAMSAVIH